MCWSFITARKLQNNVDDNFDIIGFVSTFQKLIRRNRCPPEFVKSTRSSTSGCFGLVNNGVGWTCLGLIDCTWNIIWKLRFIRKRLKVKIQFFFELINADSFNVPDGFWK